MTQATNLFKITYGKLSDNVFNSSTVTLGRIKKSYDFTGKRKDMSVPMGFQGGVGSGILPTFNSAKYEDPQITAKKIYAVAEIEREAIKASMNDEGSFVRGTKHVVEKAVESYTRNMARMIFNELDNGALGYFSGSSAGSAAAPLLTITDATWKEANFEEGDYVNVNSLSSVFEVTTVTPSAKTVLLTRISGSDDLTAIGAGTHKVYMQNSKDNDIQSLAGAIAATSGTLYGVNVQRRWQASHQQDASGAGITTDKLNAGMLEIQRKSGKVPNLIVCSFVQFRKILNMLEDQKQYIVEPRSSDLQGKVSFKGVEFMSSAGAVPIFADRFVADDKVYLMNDNYLELHHRPGHGWHEDDGTVFLRKANDDAYEARYGGYLNSYFVPTFQGYIHNLAK